MPKIPTTGTTLIEEKRTRVEKSGDKHPDLPAQSEFMDWLSACTKADWEKWQIMVRVWRGTDTKGPFIGKYTEPPFSMEWLQATYGGGPYHILGYEDKQIRWNIDIEIFGHPKNPEEVQATSATGGTALAPITGNSDMAMMLNFFRESQRELISELRASRGGDVANDAVKQAVGLSGQVFGSAVQSIQDVLRPPVATPPGNALIEKFMDAMIMRMANPTDPIETFTKMLGAMQALPGLSVGGKTDVTTELIRALPSAVKSAAEFMGSMAHAREAEFNMMRTARALPPAPGQPPAQPRIVPSPTPQAQQPPAPQQQPPAGAEVDPQTGLLVPVDYSEMIESKIVAMLAHREAPISDLANDILVYLDVENSAVTDKLLSIGEEGLLQLFRSRRILQQVPQDPRLTEFIKRFLELGAESRGTASSEPPPPPNVPDPDFQAAPSA